MSDRWTDSLSDYLDEGLEPARRAELESHLRGCSECSAVLADLRRVTFRARTLPERGPEIDLWPGIAARLATHPRPAPIRMAGPWSKRRVSFSVPQLIAACLVAAIISGAAVWYARTSGRRDAGELIPGSQSTGLGAISPAVTHPGATSAAVEEVRRALASGRDELDPATVQTLEESLMVIEVAIQQARRALDADPRNPYVRAHLDETMRRKVELLQRATMLASAPR